MVQESYTEFIKSLRICSTEKEVLKLKPFAQKFYALKGMDRLTERLAEIIIINLIKNPEHKSKKARKKYLMIVNNQEREYSGSGSKFLWQYAEKISKEHWIAAENFEAMRKVKKAKTFEDIRILKLNCPHGADIALTVYNQKEDAMK